MARRVVIVSLLALIAAGGYGAYRYFGKAEEPVAVPSSVQDAIDRLTGELCPLRGPPQDVAPNRNRRVRDERQDDESQSSDQRDGEQDEMVVRALERRVDNAHAGREDQDEQCDGGCGTT